MNPIIIRDLISIDPEVVSGAPVFKGTRVPIQILIDYVEQEESLEDFFEGFPSVSREQATKVLEIISTPKLSKSQYENLVG